MLVKYASKEAALILAGDIGGTNARFGCYAEHERLAATELRTGDYATGDELLIAALGALDCGTPDACCLAVAGPVLGDEAALTNAPIGFSSRTVAAATRARRVALVNDLVALGTAVANLPNDEFEQFGGKSNSSGAKGVIAAGTGLGMGIVVDGKCLPSEGGHARVAPVGAFERELLAATESEIQRGGAADGERGGGPGGIIAWEHYLSGRGLEALHRAVSTVWGATPEQIDAHAITQRGLDVSDPICHTTLETWTGMLATASGGLAVTALTLGGIYLAGSIPRAVAELLHGAAFRRRFEDAAWAAEFLHDMPVYLVADPLAGLEGAHIIARAAVA